MTQFTPSSQPHILFVEDALDLATVVKKECEAVGYKVTHTDHGEVALQLIQQNEYQLVLLDWMLPGMDGLSILRRLRETSAVPVLMLTARDAEIDRVLGLEVGADDYLTKPFSIRELLARVRAMLRRRELIEQTLMNDRKAETALVMGDLRIEPDQHSVSVQGEIIDLTKTEFALLYLLVSNQGRVFSRSYLLDTVWGENYIDGDRSVDNAILRLRKKLMTMGDSIETVWGVGYRWKH